MLLYLLLGLFLGLAVLDWVLEAREKRRDRYYSVNRR